MKEQTERHSMATNGEWMYICILFLMLTLKFMHSFLNKFFTSVKYGPSCFHSISVYNEKHLYNVPDCFIFCRIMHVLLHCGECAHFHMSLVVMVTFSKLCI